MTHFHPLVKKSTIATLSPARIASSYASISVGSILRYNSVRESKVSSTPICLSINSEVSSDNKGTSSSPSQNSSSQLKAFLPSVCVVPPAFRTFPVRRMRRGDLHPLFEQITLATSPEGIADGNPETHFGSARVLHALLAQPALECQSLV